MNLEVIRCINEQRGDHERDQAATSHGRDRHLRSTMPVKIVQDAQVSEEDNKTSTESMDPEPEEGQIDITPRQHITSPRRSNHQPQYYGLICDEDILLQDVCVLSSIDIQNNSPEFSPSYTTKYLNRSAYVSVDNTIEYTHPYVFSATV